MVPLGHWFPTRAGSGGLYLQTVLVVTTRRRLSADIQWVETRGAVEHLQCTGQPPTAKDARAQTSVVLLLRNPVLRRFTRGPSYQAGGRSAGFSSRSGLARR